ncbi:hypothetical protein GCM10010245_25330 [Streptomyces spectabilis]|nr:hypothetical protein GCM10010245_25330 [Streptomyces spectabilis]
MVERASQPSPTITWVRSGAALDRETFPPLASVTPMIVSSPGWCLPLGCRRARAGGPGVTAGLAVPSASGAAHGCAAPDGLDLRTARLRR